jgi:formimidoylglutamate deiminase
MPNLHSHAFQRAMAGMTERRGPGDDSFWTWRELMYRFLDVLAPDDVEAIAALVQVEMLEAGFASVAEFHYLHHRRQALLPSRRRRLSSEKRPWRCPAR